MFSSQPLPFHTLLLQKFPFQFRNSSNILPPFSRETLIHNNDKDWQAALRLLSRACFKQYKIRSYKILVGFEIHRRIYWRFEGKFFQHVLLQPLPFHTLQLQKFPSKFKNSSNFLPPFSRTILFRNKDKYREATLRIMPRACF